MQKVYLRIVRAKIVWLKFILEGYDGLCVLSTIDHSRGIVSVTYHSSNVAEVFALLTALSPDLSPYCCGRRAGVLRGKSGSVIRKSPSK